MISALKAMTGSSAKSCSSFAMLVFCALSMLFPLSIRTFTVSSSASRSSNFSLPESLILAFLLRQSNATLCKVTPSALASYFFLLSLQFPSYEMKNEEMLITVMKRFTALNVINGLLIHVMKY
jgi:hypothetical protein